MQLMPLQDLDVVLFEVEAARQNPGDFAAAVHLARTAEQLDHTAVLAVLDGAVRLRDEVGVVFGAHGWEA